MNNYNIRRNIATGVAALTLLLTSCESYFLEPDSPQYIADNISIVDASRPKQLCWAFTVHYSIANIMEETDFSRPSIWQVAN